MKPNPRNPIRLACLRFCRGRGANVRPASRALRSIGLLGIAVSFFTAVPATRGSGSIANAKPDEPAIVFAGVLSAHGRTLVALTDRASAVSRWVAPGEEFAGYTLSTYDSANDAVVLTRNQAVLRLLLKQAHVETALAPEFTAATRERQLMIWARIRELDGDKLVTALVASGNAELKFLADAHQQLVRAAMASRQALDHIRPFANDSAETSRLRQAYVISLQREETARLHLRQQAAAIKQVLRERIEQ
jgi:hypothetical protein